MSRRARISVLAIAVAAVAVVSFSPTLDHGFIQDDHPIVDQNPVVRAGNLAEIFTTDYWGGVRGGDQGLYRPVTILSYTIDRDAAHRVDPRRAHRANLVLHALASVAVLLLAMRLGAGLFGAGVGGVLFAAHPIHVSAVASLVGRAEILVLLFLVLAIGAQSAAGRWNGRSPDRRRRFAASILAGCAMFAALGSKEIAIAGPLLLAVLEFGFRRGVPMDRSGVIERIGALVPTAVATTAYLGLRAAALGRLAATQDILLSDNPLVAAGGMERIATALAIAARYAQLLFWPAKLSADYSGNVVALEPTWFAIGPLAGALFLAVLLALALSTWWPRGGSGAWAEGSGRAVAYGAWMYLLPYLVIGNLVVLVGVGMAERLIYVPSAGACIVLGAGLGWVVARAGSAARMVATIVIAALALGGVAASRAESAHWQNEETLFLAVLDSTPDSPRAHFTLGMIRLEQGRTEEALERFRETVRVWPQFSAAWYEIGQIRARRGDFAGATAAFRRSVEINPYRPEAQLAYGMALVQFGEFEAAADQFAATRERFPDIALAAVEHARVLAQLGRRREAAGAYRAAIALGRDDVRGELAPLERRGP